MLSGHDDFQYAQKALRLGVEDYCLKPFSAADLLQLLRSVSARIDEELRIRHKYAYTPENLFADLCGGLISTAAAYEAAAQLELQLTAPYYAAAIFTLQPQNMEESPEPSPASPDAEALLGGLLKEAADSFIYKRSRTEMVLIYKGSDPVQMNHTLDELCAAAKQRLRKAAGWSCPSAGARSANVCRASISPIWKPRMTGCSSRCPECIPPPCLRRIMTLAPMGFCSTEAGWSSS
ncbi:hypothetical protein ACFSQ7_31920 [Paenibacillus rhizoplanae]